MADLGQILLQARLLSPRDRAELARALSAPEPRADLPLVGTPAPHSEAWLRAERGHAVLAPGPQAAELPAGSAAIAGIWRPAHTLEPRALVAQSPGGPALVATDVCMALTEGVEAAGLFFANSVAEVRLSTATYLELLAAAGPAERPRIQRFATAYPVLSLGPVASSRSVELLFQHRDAGLQPLDALVAATALAHDIPLVTAQPAPYASIRGLVVLEPYRSNRTGVME